MPRPRLRHPTPAELEVLKVLWNRGEMTVREVLEAMHPRHRRAYTSVMSLLNVMVKKGLLTRRPKGRAFVYSPRATRSRTMSSLLRDLTGRAFDGSPSALLAHLLEGTNPAGEELRRIRAVIDAYRETPS